MPPASGPAWNPATESRRDREAGNVRAPWLRGHDNSRLAGDEFPISIGGVPVANELKILQIGTNRLFEPMHNMLLVTDSFGISMMYALLNRVEIDPSQNHATSRSKQFDITVRFPLLMCLRASVTGTPLSEIAFAYTKGRAADPVPPGKTQTTLKGSGVLVLKALTPIYVDFYEKHRRWIRDTFGGDSYAWPSLLRLRNLKSGNLRHGVGTVLAFQVI